MSEAQLIMHTVVFALIAGVVCQLLSEKLKVPSIFFLLSAGVLLGPDFADLIRPQDMGLGLLAIIEIGVAIILFEGGLYLNINQFKTISLPIQRLLTWGALITMVGATLAAWLIVELPIRYSFIFGALMIVTGPTVIGPILKRVPLREKVATILHWESILLDPIGAVAAVLITEFVLAKESSLVLTLVQFLKILLVGSLVGFASGWIMKGFLKWVRSISKETTNLTILGGALLSFQAANLLAHHSGLVAVVAAGMVLAYGTLEQREEIQEFKGTLTSLVVSFLFILLAAQLSVQELLGFGPKGWWFLAAMILIVRPLSVFLSLRKTPLQIKEKAFLSMMAPRGIVAASTASLFALIFAKEGYLDAAPLENLVYLIIGTTVVFQGLPAGLVARILRVTEGARNGVLIVGAHKLGRLIAHTLHSAGVEVKLVDTNFWHFRSALQEGLEAYHGNALNAGFLSNIQTQRVGTVLALTPNGEINILMSQLGQRLFGEGASYQLSSRLPHESDDDISKEIGGHAILPQSPYLEELEPGLEKGQYEWCEVTIPKGKEYTGAIEVAGGRFWPLLSTKMPPVQIIPYGHTFKSEEQVFGIYKADT